MGEALDWVEPPVYIMPGYGLYSGAAVIDEDKPHLGQVTWPQEACTPGSLWANCIGPTVLPSNDPGVTLTVAYGTPVTHVTFTLAGGTASGTATVDPGDGSAPIPVTLSAGGGGTATHTYLQGGSYNAHATYAAPTKNAYAAVSIAATVTPKLLPADQFGYARGFTVVNGLVCNKLGLEMEREKAIARLDLSEERQVEYAFMTGRAGNFPYLAGPSTTVLTNTAMALPDALGWLEQELYLRTGALGVIHVPRYMIGTFADRWQVKDTAKRLTTYTGTPIVFGTGYPPIAPDGGTPAATTTWIYASGPVVVRRAPVILTEVFDRTNDQMTVLAERQILIQSDCPLLAIPVTATSPALTSSGVAGNTLFPTPPFPLQVAP